MGYKCLFNRHVNLVELQYFPPADRAQGIATPQQNDGQDEWHEVKLNLLEIEIAGSI
jgi:hypothetical protein